MSFVKPTSMAAAFNRPDAVRDNDNGKRASNFNRFAVFGRDRSVSASRIPITPTSKRPPEDFEAPLSKVAKVDNNSVFQEFERTEAKLASVQLIISKTKVALETATVDPQLGGIFGGILDALYGILESQIGISSAVVDGLGLVGGRNRGRGVGAQTPEGTSAPSGLAKQAKPVLAPEEVKKRKFMSAVKDAEKSVLLFNLDLGKVPVMNTSTISMKVTQDLSARAATTEGSGSARPSEDTVAMLDDVLSMVRSMDFFSKVTKPFANKTNTDDTRNGKFCTIPVKLTFKDRDTRSQAEATLRKKCKVQCTTPYPTNLRSAIKAALDTEKAKFKEHFIQVKVDPEAFCLRLSRRQDGVWINNYATLPLDNKVMELGNTSNREATEGMDTGAGAVSTL